MEIKFLNKQVERFIENLEQPFIAKVLRSLDLLEKFGNQLGMPHCKKIDKDLFELRIRGKKEIRIFYCFRNNVVILLSAFIKKTQKTPHANIVLARKRFNSIDNI